VKTGMSRLPLRSDVCRAGCRVGAAQRHERSV
jgi:hypothetical protein